MEIKVIGIVLLIVLIVIMVYYLYTPDNIGDVPAVESLENEDYSAYLEGVYLHELHLKDQKEAMALVAEIKKRIDILHGHLGKKYAILNLKNGYGTERKNRIDVIGTTSMYSDFDIASTTAAKNGLDREEIAERIRQLFNNYDGNIYEISPTNKENLTSYTENKVKLILCLRKKTPDATGHYQLHDINTMMFVVIHELTHILNDEFDHGPKFWHLFEFMLHNSIEAGIYKPVNYAVNPINYCGLNLTHNPLFS